MNDKIQNYLVVYIIKVGMELSLEFFIFQRVRAANNISSNLSSLTNSTVEGEHSVLLFTVLLISTDACYRILGSIVSIPFSLGFLAYILNMTTRYFKIFSCCNIQTSYSKCMPRIQVKGMILTRMREQHRNCT
jgi:hypothetical protein